MFEAFLDYNFKSCLLDHFESTINEIDVQTECEFLKKKVLEAELHRTRETFIQHVNFCKTKSLDSICDNKTKLNAETLNCFCYFLKNDNLSTTYGLIGILVETDFYLSKRQIDLIKSNIGSKILFKILNQKTLLTDYVFQNISDTKSDIVQINKENLFSSSFVDFSNRNCEKVSFDCFKLFRNIKILDLSNNFLEKFNITINFNDLEELLLDNNSINSISLGLDFRQLKKLNLANNNLKRIKSNLFDCLINLSELDLSDNKIQFIEKEAFLFLKNLNYLFLSNNLLESVEFSLENCSNINQIYLCSNRIKKIRPNTLKALENLTVLNISNNLIEEIDESTFAGLKTLKCLNLAENLMQCFNFRFLKNLDCLVEIDLFRNRIRKICGLDELNELKNLDFLNLSDNLIEELDTKKLDTIKTLGLTKNNIKEIKKISMENIEHLYLNKNMIYKFELDIVDNCSNLQLLDLSDNKLDSYETSKLVNLTNSWVKCSKFHLIF